MLSAAAEAGRSSTEPWFNPVEFSAGAREVLDAAGRLASNAGCSVGVRHVACALFCEHSVGPRIAWATSQTDIRALQAELRRIATEVDTDEGEASLFLSHAKAHRPNVGRKGYEDLVLAVFEPKFRLLPVFEGHGLNEKEMQKALPKALRAVQLYERQSTPSPPKPSRPPAGGRALEAARLPPPAPSAPSSSAGRPAGEPNAGVAVSKFMKRHAEEAKEAAGPSRVLSSFGSDLVEQARIGRLDPVIGRDDEIERVLQILARRTKNNVCLVGAPGVGKTAIAEAVAQRIATGQVPRQLEKCKELWSLDIGALLAGTSLRGDFEERLRAVLEELRGSDGTRLLFIDELHLVLGAGRSESNNVDAANLMKPMLARGEIRCIGATTLDDYKKLILEKDAAFERRFQPLELQEPSAEAAEEMLKGLSSLYAAHHNVSVSPTAAGAAVRLSMAHIKGRSLPDKAIDVLDEACCLASAEGSPTVEDRHVQGVLTNWRALPWQREAGGPLHKSLAWAKQVLSRL